MIGKYNEMEYVYDLESDFIMKLRCYELGCNCYTCSEAVFDNCNEELEEALGYFYDIENNVDKN